MSNTRIIRVRIKAIITLAALCFLTRKALGTAQFCYADQIEGSTDRQPLVMEISAGKGKHALLFANQLAPL